MTATRGRRLGTRGETVTLIDFSDPGELSNWAGVNDAVMGGRSRSRLYFDPAGHALFSGTVSLENGGGFASVRRQPGAVGTARASAYLLEVCGDGRRYKFSARAEDTFDGISYQCGFHPPAGIWTSCRLPCGQFLPTWRGRVLQDHPALDPARVRQFGLLIADRQEGGFFLAIRTIGFETTTP